MSNSLIDVAIGLALLYLLLSLICTIANEYISTVLALRAKTLRAGIEKLIDDPTVRGIFLNHGLIQTAKKTPDSTVAPAPAAATQFTASYLSGRSVALALLDSLNTDVKVRGVADIAAEVDRLPSSNIKDVLVTAMTEASGDIDKLRAGVASWFDDSMDRMSGAYKRNLQLIAFLVGLAIAVVLNADTFAVARALWSDTDLRTAIGEQAQVVVTEGQDAQGKKKLDELLQTLKPLPIGWKEFAWFPEDGLWNIRWTILKLIGWAFTGLALSLGAPFWFDTLNKFMNIRGTGAKPKPEGQ